MRKTLLIKCGIVGAICVLVAVICIVFYRNRLTEHVFNESYSFSETAETSFEVTEEEKNNITLFLQKKLTEDSEYIGFKKSVADTDLYYANSVMELAKTIGEEEVTQLILDELGLLSHMDVNSMGILNLMYYVNLCDNTGIAYDKENVLECLEKYYDSETNLFFLNDSGDTINIKLVITAMCCNAMPEVAESDRFEIINGVEDAYENYEFNIDTTITLYNSGGDILYCMSVLGLLDDSMLNNHGDWFESWQEYYESIEVNSLESALVYMEYYKIAKLFDDNYSSHKLQDYYDNLTSDDMAEIADLYMINNILEYVEKLENEEVNTSLINTIISAVNEGKLYEADIDIQETAYGVMLAKNVDFEIDKIKLQNYIDASYQAVDSMELLINRVNYLYYTIVLDQLNNGYGITCEASFLQEMVNDSIKDLKFKDDIYNDVVLARKLLEIVMDLQIHNVDIQINKSQVDKIIKGIKKAVKSESVLNSMLITEIYIIDDILDGGVLDEEMFNEKYQMLTKEGGSKAFSTGESMPEIYSTYRFYVCFERMGNYDNLINQQEFVVSLQVDDGIYAYSLEDGYISLESVLYGNSLSKVILGGDKL